MQDDVFFDHAAVSRQPNGVFVIVLQTLSVRGGEPTPVDIVECREAGARSLMEAIAAVLRK